MKYFLGEIYITHRKTWFGWTEFYHKYTTSLVEAKDWITARELFNDYADKLMKEKCPKHKYEVFVTTPLNNKNINNEY